MKIRQFIREFFRHVSLFRQELNEIYATRYCEKKKKHTRPPLSMASFEGGAKASSFSPEKLSNVTQSPTLNQM